MASIKKIPEYVNILRRYGEINKIKKNETERLIQQVQIYEYMTSHFLKRWTDERAKELFLLRNNTSEIAKTLKFFSMTDLKKLKDEENSKNDVDYEEIEKLKKEQETLYNKGLNGYGPGLMELISNPLRSKKTLNLFHYGKLLANMRTNSTPEFVFDFSQTWDNEKVSIPKILGRQFQYIMSENKESPNPWPMNFVGYKKEHIGAQAFRKNIGTFETSHPDQMILPDLDPRVPHNYIPKDKKVIYISMKSRKYIDGPLDADYYVINANMDHKRESLIMARRAGTEAYALPVKKYVKWQSGPMIIPFFNMVNILKQVFENHGDWKTALEANIARRHLYPESVSDTPKKFQLIKQRQELEEIVQLMNDIPLVE
uniref:SAM-dependent MTase TRM10-type domain-containing protein n=1 Tax=Parastrongyloides trichosuri TaxID=131310 RepID=A0A0N4ZQ67_PARTI